MSRALRHGLPLGRLIAGRFFPLTATIGAAWGHDGSGAVADGATVYFRVGNAF
jgi:hypothetical protein